MPGDTDPTDAEHSSTSEPVTDGGEESVEEWLDEDEEGDVADVGASDGDVLADAADGGGDAAGAADAPTDPSVPGDLVHETSPTIKPTLLLMGLTFLAGVGVEAFLLNNPEAVGGREVMEILLYVVAFVLVVAMLRFLVRMLVLERTTYQVTTDVIRREYRLLLRHVSREVPLAQVRAHELRRNRIQALLGYGSVRFLTGGTNESLGFVEFENLIEPEELRDVIRETMDR